MPRQVRRDAPGTLQHVIGEGSAGATRVRTPEAREAFLTGVEER